MKLSFFGLNKGVLIKFQASVVVVLKSLFTFDLQQEHVISKVRWFFCGRERSTIAWRKGNNANKPAVV